MKPTMEDIKYLFTHGYCGHYAFYLYQNDPNITGVVALCLENENEEIDTVHIFGSDGRYLYDIYGKCNYSDYDAMKHIERNFPDILLEYANDDTSCAWLDDVPFSEDIIPELLNASLKNINEVSSNGLNTLQLVEIKKDLECIKGSSVSNTLKSNSLLY